MSVIFCLVLGLSPAGASPGKDDPAHERLASSSSSFDAVIVGDGEHHALLLADWASSLPLSGGSAELSVVGAEAIRFVPSEPAGWWKPEAALPAGAWSGALVVTDTTGRADVHAINRVPPPLDPDLSATAFRERWAPWLLAAGAGISLGIMGIGLGFFLGRRVGVAGAALLAAGVGGWGSREAWAHGGEDHGDEAGASVSASATLTLGLEQQFLLGLRTVVAERAPMAGTVRGRGLLLTRPGAGATLRAPAAGVVLRLPEPGRPVTAGERLVQIADSVSAGERLSILGEQARSSAELADARLALALAERDAAALNTLGDAVSERDRLARQATVEAARARVVAVERATRGAGTESTVNAPISGVVSRVYARPGEQVAEGAPLLGVVGSGRQAEVDLPASSAIGLQLGARVRLRAAETGAAFSGSVIDPGGEVDPRTGLCRVLIQLDPGPDGDPLPGLAVDAWIEVGAPELSLVVADDAVVEAGGERLIFVKTGPEEFVLRSVRLGVRDGVSWEVASGLAAGERVVVDATYALRSLAGR